MFKPMLIPNDKGKEINWNERLAEPKNWLVMPKRDGVRIEISDTEIKGRSLKPITNKHILKMVKHFQRYIKGKEFIFEAEFYSHEMTFSEIMHFFKTEDVTSIKTRTKYEKLWQKTGGDPKKGWTYPGRSVEWLTTWQPSLKLYLFDVYNPNTDSDAIRRIAQIHTYGIDYSHITFGPFYTFHTVESILGYYNECIKDGYEGLVLMNKFATYKKGRVTLKEGIIYKMKNDNLEYDGQIIGLVQATVVDPNVPTTKNELGRTVTSKKKDDRILIEAISGFLVRMDDGRELIVGLRGWNDTAKQMAWQEGFEAYKDVWITFTGMEPVKEGGDPRHAQFKSYRDPK